MQDTRTRVALPPGRTRASTQQECRSTSSLYALFSSVLTTELRRRKVFVLGPSHHVYLDGCALTRCNQYETPLGPLPIDIESEPVISS